jgi:hypothetical protein
MRAGGATQAVSSAHARLAGYSRAQIATAAAMLLQILPRTGKDVSQCFAELTSCPEQTHV